MPKTGSSPRKGRSEDEVAVVEAAYRLDLIEKEWLAGIGGAAAGMLDAGLGLTVSTWVESPAGEPHFRSLTVVGGPAGLEAAAKEAYEDAALEIRTGLFRSAPVTSLSASGVVEFVQKDAASKALLRLGIRDCVTIYGVASRGGAVLQAFHPQAIRPSRSFVSLWSRIGSHIGAGMRVRRGLRTLDSLAARPDAVLGCEAILSPDGRIEHVEAPAEHARKVLAHAVVAINRVRSKLRTEDPLAAIEAWKALVAGRWSLFDHVDSDGKRFLVARKNDPDHAGPTGVSRRELQILASRARGFSLKLIAYDLGLSIAGVSRGLQSGMTKLGVRHEGELAAFFSQPPAVAPHGRDRASLRHPFGHRSGALVKAGRNWSSVMKGSWWSFFAVPGGRVS